VPVQWAQSDGIWPLPLPPQTANPIPCIHPAGIGRSSRQRIAIGHEGQVAVAGGWGEEGFALVEGHEQQVGVAGFVPEDAFAVDPGGVVVEGHLPERDQGHEWEC
jgi:hypothetical protein